MAPLLEPFGAEGGEALHAPADGEELADEDGPLDIEPLMHASETRNLLRIDRSRR